MPTMARRRNALNTLFFILFSVYLLISIICYWLLAIGSPPLFKRLRVCARNEALWGICQRPKARSYFLTVKLM
jgi:hypothetical protein